MLLKSPRRGGYGVRLALFPTVALMLTLGACSSPMLPFGESALLPAAEQKKGSESPLAVAHKANPSDVAAALAYAKALRASGAKTEALGVLETTAQAKPADRRLTLERGLLALETGDPAKAETLLRAAHDPKAPDWRLHSALGAALATRGRQPEAQAQFAKALALAPNNPSVLNNLALSYAMDGKAGEAEKVLRTAVKAKPDGRVQQNLALVLGLGGKYAEARTVAEAALPADKATANVAYLQKMAEARTAAAPQGPGDDATPRKAANAGLPPPTYQLGAGGK